MIDRKAHDELIKAENHINAFCEEECDKEKKYSKTGDCETCLKCRIEQAYAILNKMRREYDGF